MATLCLPAAAQEWELQRSVYPHAYKQRIDSIGFYGNSQVIFGRGEAIFNWNLSTRRWRSKFWDLPGEHRVDHIEVSPTHDIVAHTLRDYLYLRRASDLSLIDVVALRNPRTGNFALPDYLAMEPRTNYLMVGAYAGGQNIEATYFADVYDLWENSSWGLNLSNSTQSSQYDAVILNQTYAYTTWGGGAGGRVREEIYNKTESRGNLTILKKVLLSMKSTLRTT